MIINIIIIAYVILAVLSSLAQIVLIGKIREPITPGTAIANIIIVATFLIALYFKIF